MTERLSCVTHTVKTSCIVWIVGHYSLRVPREETATTTFWNKLPITPLQIHLVGTTNYIKTTNLQIINN